MAATHPTRLISALAAGGLLALAVPVVALLGLAGTATPEPAALPAGAVAGVPARVGQAYQAAAGRCPGLDWTLLAAVGGVETNHGQYNGATVDPDTGEATPWIYGPPLDSRNDTAALLIGDWTGSWGLAGPWQQAVGPMQILPATFTAHAVDADADGTANPHDVDDAVATTANYICSAAGDHVDGPDEIARIYNPGDATNYAAELTAEQNRIRQAAENAGAVAASLCPVAGPVTFSDTWGASRSGGRSHQGVDMFADEGTPVIAVAPGRVEHYNNSLGGLSYRLYADDGTFYYGTHLSAYGNEGAGHVDAGTVIGYVGRTGNAATTPPHLHWEIHPAGRGTPAINPTPTADALCPANKS
jgi:murein DD-endopeptidase MepM/ murein hydrolase activator NlpD